MSIERFILLLIGVSAVHILGLIILVIFILNEKNIKNNSTAKINGRVIGYDYGRPAKPPKIEYIVDDKAYRKILQYQVVTTISSPRKGIKAKTDSDLLAKKIKIYQNSFISHTTMLKDAFPVGSQMTVWYNPKNPKKAYVERYAGPLNYLFINLVVLCFSWIGLITFMIFAYINKW